MDNQQKTDSTDKDHIDVNDAAGMGHWSDKLNVTKVKLKAAINAVGPSVKVVEAYLNRKK